MGKPRKKPFVFGWKTRRVISGRDAYKHPEIKEIRANTPTEEEFQEFFKKKPH